MKLNLLSLAVVALVTPALAVPPKHLKLKRTDAKKIAKLTRTGNRGVVTTPQAPKKIQTLNEGYQPGN